MLPFSLSIDEACAATTEPWHPRDLVRFNPRTSASHDAGHGDCVIRLAMFQGEYHWHSHANEDEVFIVWRGEITIQIRGSKPLILKEGEICVVPRGIEHCPKADSPAYVLMIEPASLESGGS